MLLKRGDKGDGVKQLQRGLNKVGSLLLIDGDFGTGTEAAVADARAALQRPGPPEADDALQDALAGLPEPSRDLTSPGVTFIAREEVSSPAEYRRRYKRPVWPGADSGITIGIGYDLRFATEANLQADWGGLIPPGALARFTAVLGTRGSADLLAKVADVEIALPAAVSAFLARMMPEHVRHTRGAYPMLDDLPAPRRTALISLVFNRGADLDGGDRRREMKRIRELLAAGDADAVAEQFESMARLWNPVTERGLIERRGREATLWRSGFGALQLE
jgi:peptidoglycan hydrolase-like protein with peptidoglycan-binding domain